MGGCPNWLDPKFGCLSLSICTRWPVSCKCSKRKARHVSVWVITAWAVGWAAKETTHLLIKPKSKSHFKILTIYVTININYMINFRNLYYNVTMKFLLIWLRVSRTQKTRCFAFLETIMVLSGKQIHFIYCQETPWCCKKSS